MPSKMSSSKVLKRMWSEMKANFKDMLSRAKVEDKIPSQKELEDYQSAVQDFVEIFDAVEEQGLEQKGNAKKIEVAPGDEIVVKMVKPTTKDEPDDFITQARVRKDGPSLEDRAYIWSVYTSNDRQFFTQHHAKEIGLTIHRRAATVLSTLQKLIDADPDNHDSKLRFSVLEDEQILSRYTTDLADSYNSEGAIIADLSKELSRSNKEIRSRLRYLKEHNPQRVKHAPARPYTAEEDKFVSDLSLTVRDVAQIIGRGAQGVKSRRKTLRLKGFTDNGGAAAQEHVMDTTCHSTVETVARTNTLPVVEADKKASLWFEDKRFSSQPSPISEYTQSTSNSSGSQPGRLPVERAVAEHQTNENKRRKTAADFMHSSRFDDPVEEQSRRVPQISTPSHPRDIEVIVLLDESPPPSTPRTSEQMSPPTLSLPPGVINFGAAHSDPHSTIPTSSHHFSSHTVQGAGWGTSSREIYCPPPPRHGSVIKPHAYAIPAQEQAPPTMKQPHRHRSYADLRAQAVTRFVTDLEMVDMTVLQPRLAHDQMLAIVIGCMLQRHSNNTSPAPDCHAIAKEVFELTSTNNADLGLVKEVMTCSYSALVQVVNLLDRAGCLCALSRPPNHQGLQLADGMKSFTALCRRHDAYLENRMGSDASLLRELLWPRDEHEERRRSKMDVLVRLVMRRLAWD